MDSSSPETQAPDSSAGSHAQPGFRAHLQGVGLHDLVMLQDLVRSSGVFVVLSGDRAGSLHFSRGQLLHAETEELVGDAAALEILSWREGEFINSERTAPEKTTVVASLDALLLRLASEGDEAQPPDAPLTTATGVRRRMEGSTGLRKTHQGLGLPSPPAAGSQAPSTGQAPSTSQAGIGPAPFFPPPSPLPPAAPIAPLTQPPPIGPAPAGPAMPAAPPASGQAPQSQRLAAAATPGVAAVAPKTPTRAGEPRPGVTNVLVAPHGALLDGNGADAEALAAKVAYMARLTDLVGQAMGAGETRAVKVRTPSNDLTLRCHADGHVTASLGPVDTSADAPPPPASSPPSSVRLP